MAADTAIEPAIDTSTPQAEPVNVLRRADEPAHFLWRGRLYAVRAVRAHWFASSGAGGPVPDGSESGDTGRSASAAVAAPVEPPEGSGTAEGRGRELWRVEAASGRMAPPGVFDLCLAGPDGHWTLAPVPEQDR